MPAARGPGLSGRKTFYGFDAWQAARLNALTTDGSGGKRQAWTYKNQFHTCGGPRRCHCLGQGRGRRITIGLLLACPAFLSFLPPCYTSQADVFISVSWSHSSSVIMCAGPHKLNTTVLLVSRDSGFWVLYAFVKLSVVSTTCCKLELTTRATHFHKCSWGYWGVLCEFGTCCLHAEDQSPCRRGLLRFLGFLCASWQLQSSAIKCNQVQSSAINRIQLHTNCAVADGGLSSAKRRKRHDISTFPRSA